MGEALLLFAQMNWFFFCLLNKNLSVGQSIVGGKMSRLHLCFFISCAPLCSLVNFSFSESIWRRKRGLRVRFLASRF